MITRIVSILNLDEWAKKARLPYPAKYYATIGLAIIIVSIITSVIFLFLRLFIFSALMCMFVLSGFAMIFYPKIIALERARTIENALPFATIYLSTIAASGFPPHKMFQMLSKFKEYSELSKECAQINQDIQLLGLDLPSALRRAIDRSPSPRWSELLAGIGTSVISGGNLHTYLQEYAKSAVTNFKAKLAEFSTVLAIAIQIYVTLIIVGAVFFIVISSIMSSIGGVPVQTIRLANYLFILVGLPVLTAIFILVTKGLSPTQT